MTKEQILEKSFNQLLKPKFGSIVGEFSEANTNNGYEWVYTAMEEYKTQELTAEREKAAKLWNDIDRVLRQTECCKEDYVIMSIRKILEQSLTEYKKQ